MRQTELVSASALSIPMGWIIVSQLLGALIHRFICIRICLFHIHELHFLLGCLSPTWTESALTFRACNLSELIVFFVLQWWVLNELAIATPSQRSIDVGIWRTPPLHLPSCRRRLRRELTLDSVHGCTCNYLCKCFGDRRPSYGLENREDFTCILPFPFNLTLASAPSKLCMVSDDFTSAYRGSRTEPRKLRGLQRLGRITFDRRVSAKCVSNLNQSA